MIRTLISFVILLAVAVITLAIDSRLEMTTDVVIQSLGLAILLFAITLFAETYSRSPPDE